MVTVCSVSFFGLVLEVGLESVIRAEELLISDVLVLIEVDNITRLSSSGVVGQQSCNPEINIEKIDTVTNVRRRAVQGSLETELNIVTVECVVGLIYTSKKNPETSIHLMDVRDWSEISF